MDLTTLLADIPTAKERDYYISVVGDSQSRFDELLISVFREKDPIKWRAAWILDGCDEKNPTLSEKHLTTIIHKLPELGSEGTLRSLLRLLSRHTVPEKDQGMLVDLCFNFLTSGLNSVAVKVYAMQIIYNHSMIYPELARELITIIEDQFAYNSAGFKARGTMIINQLQKQKSKDA